MLHIDAKRSRVFKNGYIEKVKARGKRGRKGVRDYKMDQEKKEIKYSTLGNWLNTLYTSIHLLEYYTDMKNDGI